MKFKLKHKTGFTLIELILYIGIVSIIMSTLILFTLNILGGGVKSTTKQELSSQARYLSERVKSEIRNAQNINFIDSDFDINLALNSGKKLSLAADEPNNPTIIDVSNGKVRIKQGINQEANLNSTDTQVTNLTFTSYSSSDNKSKHISFILSIKSAFPGVRQEYQDEIMIESSSELRSN